MDLKAIRDHLALARLALGADHPIAGRLRTVERKLTPGDASWGGDAVTLQADLLAISAELEQLPKILPPDARSTAPGADSTPAEIPPGVNVAIEQIGNAIELL